MPRSPVPIDDDRLAREATRLCAATALQALRGPDARGAVHLEELAELLSRDEGQKRIERSALTNKVRKMTEGGTSPFDVVCRHVHDPELPENRDGRDRGFRVFSDSTLGPLGNDSTLHWVEPAVKEMLRSSFSTQTEEVRRDLTTVGRLAVAAASMHVWARGRYENRYDRNPQSEIELDLAADRVLQDRIRNWTVDRELYLVAFRWILRTTGRRARAGYSERDIVIAMQSLFDGFMTRRFVDPDNHSVDTLVDTVWDLAMSMTENGRAPTGEVETCLEHYLETALRASQKQNRPPSLDDPLFILPPAGDVQLPVFANDSELAAACLDMLLLPAWEVCTFALSVKEASDDALTHMLEVVESVGQDFPALVLSSPSAPIWEQIQSSN